MIFVTVGTERFPFDRLIRSVDNLVHSGVIKEEVFFQIGPCHYLPKHGEWKRYLPFGDVKGYIEKSHAVIGHAGVATILLSHLSGKKPIVMPRTKGLGEHVDDHQVEFAKRIAREEWVIPVYEEEELRQLFVTSASPDSFVASLKPAGQLANYLTKQFKPA